MPMINGLSLLSVLLYSWNNSITKGTHIDQQDKLKRHLSAYLSFGYPKNTAGIWHLFSDPLKQSY